MGCSVRIMHNDGTHPRANLLLLAYYSEVYEWICDIK
jgi:hypothetical protein